MKQAYVIYFNNKGDGIETREHTKTAIAVFAPENKEAFDKKYLERLDAAKEMYLDYGYPAEEALRLARETITTETVPLYE